MQHKQKHEPGVQVPLHGPEVHQRPAADWSQMLHGPQARQQGCFPTHKQSIRSQKSIKIIYRRGPHLSVGVGIFKIGQVEPKW